MAYKTLQGTQPTDSPISTTLYLEHTTIDISPNSLYVLRIRSIVNQLMYGSALVHLI